MSSVGVGVGKPNSNRSYNGYKEVVGEDITALPDENEEEGRYQLMVDRVDAINLDFLFTKHSTAPKNVTIDYRKEIAKETR
jgi:hypothetical protein